MFYEYIILLVFVLDAITCDGTMERFHVSNEPPLNFVELASKYGHHAKTYHITTEDGYILELNNIPGDKSKPVIVAHGVYDSGKGFIIRGNRSLAIMASDEEYDVWACNFRGNTYSRNHTTLDPDVDPEFWDYSAHEYGTYDLPACIDFVLNKTGQKQLSIVGFSEGTTAVFILGSTRPEYNEKVKLFIALAPVAYLEHVRPVLSMIITFSPFIDFILPQSVQEMSGHNSKMKGLLNIMCTQLSMSYELCYHGGLNSVSGAGSDGIEREFLPTIIEHFPSGTSRKNLIHFAKISLQKSFGQYDYGTDKNLKVYKSAKPPVYDMSRVTMATVAVSGRNDPVSTMKDVQRLLQELPNVVDHRVVERSTFNHLDFMWARDAPELVYEDILDLLEEYNESNDIDPRQKPVARMPYE